MTKNLKYQNGIACNTCIKAIIASSHIVFIGDGEAHVFPDEKG